MRGRSTVNFLAKPRFACLAKVVSAVVARAVGSQRLAVQSPPQGAPATKGEALCWLRS